MERDDEDLRWVKARWPAPPPDDDPLVRRTVAGARERARRQRGRGGVSWLWGVPAALALGAAMVLVVPEVETEGVVAWVVEQPSDAEWEEAAEALAKEDLASGPEFPIPDAPGLWDVDEEDLTDEELTAVALRLRLRS